MVETRKECGTCQYWGRSADKYPCSKCSLCSLSAEYSPCMWEPVRHNMKEQKMENKVKPIDWTKPVVSSAGRPVRILATDLKYNGDCTATTTGDDCIGVCDPDDTSCGLKNAPVKCSGYVAIGTGGVGESRITSFCHDNEEDAKNNYRARFRGEIAAVAKVEWEE